MNKNFAFTRVQAALAFIVVFLGLPMNAQSVTSPAYLKVKIFEMRVSRNSDCSGAVSVFVNANPDAVDLFGSPGLGSGVISTGTYHCVMFNISDRITYSPKDNIEPFCVAGTAYTYDIFQSGASISPEGVPISGTGNDDKPWIYLSDAPTAASVGNACFLPTKTGAAGPCAMAPLTILSDQAHSLVMNATNQLGAFGSSPPTCILNPTDPMVISVR